MSNEYSYRAMTLNEEGENEKKNKKAKVDRNRPHFIWPGQSRRKKKSKQ